MSSANADRELIDYVERQINSGATRIALPGNLVARASEEVLQEIGRLCKLNGVSVEVRL